MKANPKVSIVIINYLDPKDTLELLNSLKSVSYANKEIVLVDNGCAEDKTPLYQSRYQGVKVYNSEENRGFAGGVNYGIQQATGEYILLLNNDTTVSPGFLEPLVRVFEKHQEVGMVSPKILFHGTPNLIQYAGASSISPWLGRGRKIGYGKKDGPSYADSGLTGLCNGACLLIRKEVIQDVGLLSEDYFMYYEEHDFCLRAKRYGWKMYYEADSRIYHKQSMSMGKDNPLKTYYLFRNRLLFMRRFYQGLSLWFFSTYFTLIKVPLSIIKNLFRGRIASAKYIVGGLLWNIKN